MQAFGKREPEQELEAREWIETITGEKFPEGNQTTNESVNKAVTELVIGSIICRDINDRYLLFCFIECTTRCQLRRCIARRRPVM